MHQRTPKIYKHFLPYKGNIEIAILSFLGVLKQNLVNTKTNAAYKK